jgi:hypothetical protein
LIGLIPTATRLNLKSVIERGHPLIMSGQTLPTASPYSRIVEATIGLDKLIEALSRSEKRALKSQLARVVLHTIKWRARPERRSLKLDRQYRGCARRDRRHSRGNL